MSRTPPPFTDAPPQATLAPPHAAPPHAAPSGPAPAPTAPAQATPPDADAAVFAPRLASGPEPCSACGALLAADQRYCLSCGERRSGMRVPFPAAPAPAPLVAPAPRRRIGLPESALSALYGMAGAAAIGLGLLAGALIIQAGDDPAPQAALAAQPTATPSAAAPTATQAPPVATAAATFTPDWPAGQNGWTVQLQALPKDGTTPEAVTAAKAEATAGGAPDVGALDSDAFPTLDGGNFVVYSGIATSKQDAESALDGLIANFPDATVIEVADTAAEPTEEEPVTKSKEELKEKEQSQTPEDAQKNTRKAPPTVESEGPPPPADDEEPGAGSDVTEIG